MCLTRFSILTLLLDPSCDVSTSSNGVKEELASSTCGTSHTWSPRFCVGWEVPVQLEELRVVGASSENSYCLCLPLIWKAQFSTLVLAHSKYIILKNQMCGRPLCLGGLSPCRCKTCLRFAFLSRCRSLLVRTECNTSPSPGLSPVRLQFCGELWLPLGCQVHHVRIRVFLLLLLLQLVAAFLGRRLVRFLCSSLASSFR